MNELRELLVIKIESMGYWDVVDNEMTQTINADNIVKVVCDTIADYLKGGAE